jgi:hypothetical protein
MAPERNERVSFLCVCGRANQKGLVWEVDIGGLHGKSYYFRCIQTWHYRRVRETFDLQD